MAISWRSGATLPVLALSLLLDACAGRAATSVATAGERTAVPNGALVAGIVVAIRPVTAAQALSPGASAVLAALQLAPPPHPGNATEFVIRQSDGSIATIVVGAPAAAPTASLSATNFALGDQVELLTGARTELIHNP